MLNKRTKIIGKWRHRSKYDLASYDGMDWNIRCKAEVSWNCQSFLSLRQSDLVYFWSSLTEILSISINFNNRCIFCGLYSTGVLTIIRVDIFHGSKGDFPITCAVKISYCSKFDHCSSFGWRLLSMQHETLSFEKSSTLHRFTLALY